MSGSISSYPPQGLLAMPPTLLFDLSDIDLDHVLYGVDEIEAINPQRGDMRQLDAVCWARHGESSLAAAGFKDCREDEFWVPGHIPGRPLLPGVLMIESAAQLAAFMIKKFRQEPGFLGFLGCSDIKFRGQVTPGQRFYIIGHETDYRPGRRFRCVTQGLCEGKVVFEGVIHGMSM